MPFLFLPVFRLHNNTHGTERLSGYYVERDAPRTPENRQPGGSAPATPDEVLERLEEAVEEGFEAVGEAVEEGFEAVGESVLALDDRVERARASVETALNELVRVCVCACFAFWIGIDRAIF